MLYAVPECRVCGDVDLYVGPENEERAQSVLKSFGVNVYARNPVSLNEEECDMKIRKCVVREIIINSESKEDLLNTLERIGINEATLFPEVDKIANYLRNRRI